MRRLLYVKTAFLLISVLIFSGCSDQASNTPDRLEKRAHEAYKSVNKEVQAGKEVFVNRAEKELSSLHREISELKKQISEHSGQTKRRLNKKWSRLNNRREKLQKDLDELKARTTRDWKELKQVVNEQLNNLTERYKNLRNELVIG